MRTTALSLTETITPSAIGLLRRRAAGAVAQSGADGAVVAAVRLCVSEALANAVMHAYQGEEGTVNVVIELDGKVILVTIRDEGRGLAANRYRRGDEGGLGFEIIRNLTNSFKLTSESGRGTELQMTFHS